MFNIFTHSVDLSNLAFLLCLHNPMISSLFSFPQFFLTCIHIPQDLAVGSECLRLFAEICCFKKLQLFWSWGTSLLQVTLKLWFFSVLFPIIQNAQVINWKEVLSLSRVRKHYIPLKQTSVATSFVTVISLCSPLSAPVAFHGCQSNQFMMEERPLSLEIECGLICSFLSPWLV